MKWVIFKSFGCVINYDIKLCSEIKSQKNHDVSEVPNIRTMDLFCDTVNNRCQVFYRLFLPTTEYVSTLLLLFLKNYKIYFAKILLFIEQ